MGVVHKLKNEVIEFILAARRTDPKLSVRKLAETSTQQFHIPISKSSVNNVLKSAQLSNPIGRPGGLKNPSSKQFTIPSPKKDLIRQSMQQTGFVEIPPSVIKKENPPAIQKSVVEKKDKFPAEDIARKIFAVPAEHIFKETPTEKIKIKKQDHKKEEVAEEKSVEVPSPPVSLESIIPPALDNPEDRPSLLRGGNFPEEIEVVQSRKHLPQGAVLKAMGTIFLHAASLALAKKSFLAEALERVIAHDDILYFPKLAQAEIFCRGLKHFLPSLTDNFSEYGFWQLLGFNSAVDRAEFQRRLVQAEFSFPFSASYLLEKEQLDLKINAIKLTLDDGISLSIDARNSTLWPKKAPPTHLQMPVNSAVDILSQQIIANTKPLVIGVFPSSESPKMFDNFIQFFSGQRNIKKAALIDFKGQEIAQFSIIPQMKRKFIFGVYHHQTEFSDWQKFFPKELRPRAYYEELTDNTVCIRSVSIDTPVPGLKVVEISYPQTKKPFCVLVTNWVEASEENILQEYQRFWPYWAEGVLGEILENKDMVFTQPRQAFSNSSPLQSIEDIFIDYFQFLHGQVMEIFGRNISEGIDISWFIENIYMRDGQLSVTNDQIMLFLKLSNDEKSDHILDILIREVNEKNIMDEKGRKIYINYCK